MTTIFMASLTQETFLANSLLHSVLDFKMTVTANSRPVLSKCGKSFIWTVIS